MLSSHTWDTVSLVFIGSYPIMSSCYLLIYLLRSPQSGRIIDCPVIWQSVERSKRFRSFTLRVPITQTRRWAKTIQHPHTVSVYIFDCWANGEGLWDLHSLYWSFTNLNFQPSYRRDIMSRFELVLSVRESNPLHLVRWAPCPLYLFGSWGFILTPAI